MRLINIVVSVACLFPTLNSSSSAIAQGFGPGPAIMHHEILPRQRQYNQQRQGAYGGKWVCVAQFKQYDPKWAANYSRTDAARDAVYYCNREYLTEFCRLRRCYRN